MVTKMVCISNCGENNWDCDVTSTSVNVLGFLRMTTSSTNGNSFRTIATERNELKRVAELKQFGAATHYPVDLRRATNPIQLLVKAPKSRE